MDLNESKFYYAGEDMNFAVFSDCPCRVRYVESIRLPIDLAPVEIYTIEPAANGQWIVEGKCFERTRCTISLCI
jgi:hypothetical protein